MDNPDNSGQRLYLSLRHETVEEDRLGKAEGADQEHPAQALQVWEVFLLPSEERVSSDCYENK